MQLDNQIPHICPRLGLLQTRLRVQASPEALWEHHAQLLDARRRLSAEDIREQPVIQAARAAYKALGQDPSRYRLSAEALLRRLMKSQSLYRINNVVDIINLVSLETGFSMGAYDSQQIEGPIVLRAGTADDDYEGLGRGALNIDRLPCLSDRIGPFGTPTSDSLRTSVQDNTQQLLLVVFDFGRSPQLEECLNQLQSLLERYAEAQEKKHEYLTFD